MFVQRLSPNGTETLLDHHLAAFDEWLRKRLSRRGLSSDLSHFLTAVTLLDQLNLHPEEFNWQTFSVLLETDPISGCLVSIARSLTEPVKLFDGTASQLAYSQIVSKFLTDQERAGYSGLILGRT